MIQHASQPDNYYIDGGLWARGRNGIVFVALIAWVAMGAGYVLEPNRFFESYLVAFLLCVSVVFGSMFFVMVQYLTGSAWSVPMRRIAENIMMTVPIGALLFIPVAAGLHHLYHWSHAEAVAKDALLRAKAGYLNEKWFFIRAAIFFSIWTLWAWRIYANSTRQDKTKSLDQMHAISRWSAPGLLVLILSVTLASFDWSMSLDPHWYSTIFGLYVFTGGARAFLSVWTLVCMGLRGKGVLRNTINIEHYHDLGKWMFALTIFWAYIAFSQYLLIWYANIPEETIWYKHRMEGSWKWWSLLLLLGHFVVPFLGLVTRAAKRNMNWLRIAAIWILTMQFVDFYYQVMPTFTPHGVHLHWLDFAAVAAVGSAFALAFWFRVKKHALLPVGDPRFQQGIQFQNS